MVSRLPARFAERSKDRQQRLRNGAAGVNRLRIAPFAAMHSGRIVVIRNAQESVPRHDAEQPVRGRDRTVLPDVRPHKVGVSGRKLNLPRLPAERHRLALHAMHHEKQPVAGLRSRRRIERGDAVRQQEPAELHSAGNPFKCFRQSFRHKPTIRMVIRLLLS